MIRTALKFELETGISPDQKEVVFDSVVTFGSITAVDIFDNRIKGTFVASARKPRFNPAPTIGPRVVFLDLEQPRIIDA